MIEQTYGAVGDPAGWEALLVALSDLFHGGMSVLFTQDLQTAAVPFIASARSDPDFEKSYEAYYASVNIWTQRGPRDGSIGTIRTDQMIVPDEREFLASEWYNDWLRPQDLYHVIGSTVLQRGARMSLLSVLRSQAAGPFRPEELALWQSLTPHFARAVELHDRLGGLTEAKEATEDALDRLPSGVVLLDAAGGTIFANRAARDIFATCDGLAFAGDRVTAARQGEDAVLQRLIGESIATTLSAGTGPGGTLAVPCPSGKRDYAVVVSPLPRGGTWIDGGAGRAAALLLIADPESVSFPVGAVLRDIYGLTPRELDLAQALASGERIKDAADRLSLSTETARSYLKRLFAKTDTHSQAQLVALLLRAAPFGDNER